MAPRCYIVTFQYSILLFIFFQLCTCYALDDMDQYKHVQKRIFCNYFGCRNMNGKREYPKANKRYNMFNRPSQSKRSEDVDFNLSPDGLRHDFHVANSETSGINNDIDWDTDLFTNAESSLESPALFGNKNRAKHLLLNKYNGYINDGEGDDVDNENIDYLLDDEEVDINKMSHYEKYKILKEALEIIHQMKSQEKRRKRASNFIEGEDFRKWLEQRRK